MDVQKLSRRYAVRPLDEQDAESVLRFCEQNAPFYRYCGMRPDLQQVRQDMTVCPEGVEPARKHYVGFFDGDEMVSVMDYIEDYPDPESGYIGFFMMNIRLQGRGVGSEIIAEAAEYLRSDGVKRLRLAIASDNPQANHFWKKNGFAVVKAVDMGGWTALVADRML